MGQLLGRDEAYCARWQEIETRLGEEYRQIQLKADICKAQCDEVITATINHGEELVDQWVSELCPVLMILHHYALRCNILLHVTHLV